MTTLAVGTMNFGKRTAAPEATRIVERALSRGLTVFDTANVYNDGESEKILGRALGAGRKNIEIASKVGLARIGGKVEGLSPAAIASAIDATLQRLGTDYLDYYYLHAPDPATPIDETLGAIAALVTQGKIRKWGVSNCAAWQILDMTRRSADAEGGSRLGLPAISQVLYNLLIRELDIEYFAFARRFKLHTTVYNPLAGGLLSGTYSRDSAPAKGSRFDANAMYRRRYFTPAMFERVEALRATAESVGFSLLELSYAWLAARPGVDSILVGPATVAQLDAAIDAIGKPVSQNALTQIDALHDAWRGTDVHYAR